jgi:hypothetical protein
MVAFSIFGIVILFIIKVLSSRRLAPIASAANIHIRNERS